MSYMNYISQRHFTVRGRAITHVYHSSLFAEHMTGAGGALTFKSKVGTSTPKTVVRIILRGEEGAAEALCCTAGQNMTKCKT